MEVEIWRCIPGFEDRYEASTLGRVRSLSYRGHAGIVVMCSSRNYAGYHVVSLGASRKQFRVPRLILETFVGKCPERMQACHKDGDRDNNQLSNLYWGTAIQNTQDRSNHGNHYRGETNPNAKLTDTAVLEIKSRLLAGEKRKLLAQEYGVTITRICQIGKKYA